MMPDHAEHTNNEDSHGPLASEPHPHSLALRVALMLIVLATITAFAGIVQNDFVDWDDDYALLRNEAYRGLSGEHLHWMFTTTYTGHYQPLTWLSFAVDWYVWGGVSAPGVHLSNLVLHVLTAIGFFFVARRLIAAAGGGHGRNVGISTILGALFAALVFAVHPLRVESVAWATERRDVLGGAWLMLTVLLYLRAVDSTTSPRMGRAAFGLSIVCYATSLLSKASAITLPVVLLLLDIYPLRRFRPSGNRVGESEPTPPTSATGGGRYETSQRLAASRRAFDVPLPRIIVEKMLFAVPAVLIAGIALWAQAGAGAMRTLQEHPIGLRIGQAMFGVVFYVWKTVLPTGLIPLYEQDPQATAFDPVNLLSAGVVIAACTILWLQRKRWPGLTSTWVVYLCLLAPVLGLAQSGPQVVADRYSYFSCLPWAVLLGGGVSWVWSRLSPKRSGFRAGFACVMLAIVASMTLATRAQTRIWSDSETLWTTVVDRDPNSGTGHANLAVVLNKKGNYEDARKHSLRALEILPGNRVAHFALARSSAELGDLTTAEKHFTTALAIRPDDPSTLVHLASVQTRLGHFAEAETHYRRLINLAPIEPAWHFNLGSFLASRERHNEARAAFEEAVRLDPNNADASLRLSVVLLKLEQPGAAIAVLEAGLRRVPDDVHLAAKLAWILATCRDAELRDGERAVALADQAAVADGDRSVAPLESLAAALAETGDFARAIETLNHVLSDAIGDLPLSISKRLRLQLSAYERGERVRE